MTAELTPEDIKQNFSEITGVNLHIVYTQIGKANSARALQRKIDKLNGDVTLVVNFGTAGARNLPNGVYFGTELYEDMFQEALGLPRGINLNSNFGYEENLIKEAWTGQKIILTNPFENKIKSVKILSRDAFVTDAPPIEEASQSLEEMEAHGLSVTCILNGYIPFFPIKRVSNSVGGDTNTEQQKEAFCQELKERGEQNPFIIILKEDILPLVKSGELKSNIYFRDQDKDHSFCILGMENVSCPQNIVDVKDSMWANKEKLDIKYDREDEISRFRFK
jgi:nucleoside phosphorylase